jgi:hypothetical protein
MRIMINHDLSSFVMMTSGVFRRGLFHYACSKRASHIFPDNQDMERFMPEGGAEFHSLANFPPG